MASNSPVPRLTEADSRYLRDLVEQFNQSWDGKQLAAYAQKLPAGAPALRRAGLRELVAIDLRRRWLAGSHVKLEQYLRVLPELGSADTVEAALIEAEADARRQSGNAVALEQYAQRFPRQFPHLRMAARGAKPKEVFPVGPAPAVRVRPRDRGDASVGDAGARRILVVAAAAVGAFLLLAVVVLTIILMWPRGNAQVAAHQTPPPLVPELPVVHPAAPAPDPDPDFMDPELSKFVPPDAAILTNATAEFDAVGDAQVHLELRLPPALHAFMRRQYSRPLAALDAAPDGQPTKENVLGMMALDADEGLWENVNAEFGDKLILVEGRCVSCAKRQAGHWSYGLSAEESEPFKLVSKKHSREVLLRKVHESADGQTMIEEDALTLPEGAHNIEVVVKPNRLIYDAPDPVAAARSAEKPVLTVTPKPHILSALAKLYSDRRFGDRWAARSNFHNASSETLHDYRIRFKLGAYSEWSDWSRADRVFPGQSVVDSFRPVIDFAKVRDLTTTTPVDVAVEYEYVLANGDKVADAQTARTSLLGMNEAVFSDVETTPDSTWYNVYKDAPWILASFTSADDPIIQDVVGMVAKAGGGVASSASDQEAVKFLAQLYLLMRGNIAYETTPGAILGGLPHQHLKYGRDVLRTRSGTCVNTSIFFASAAEAAGLHPVIVLIPGHAFAGVRLPKSGQLFVVETTGCGGGTLETSIPFERAVESASKTLAKYLKEGPILPIDIAEMRKRGVTPPQLPAPGQNSLAAWKIVMPDGPALAAGGGQKPAEGLGATHAVVTDLRVAPDDIAGNTQSMRISFRLSVTGAKGHRCQLAALFAGKDGKLVKSADPAYSAGGLLVVVKETEVFTSDDEEVEDVDMVLPMRTLPLRPGKNVFLCVIGVICEGQSLIEGEPPAGVFTITR